MKNIIIDLNQRKTFFEDREYGNFFAPWLFDDLKSILKERIAELEKFKKKSFNNPELKSKEFQYMKKNDAIVVEGLRGAGKTTFLESIPKFIKDKNLPILTTNPIDTNEILSKRSIILVLLLELEKLLERAEVYGNSFEKELNKKILETKGKIQRIRETIESSLFFDNIFKMDTVEFEEYFHDLGERVQLREKIHNIAKNVCEIFNVKAILVLIDDLDMDFQVYERTVDEIRRYTLTNYLIPIVAFDVNQLYLLMKKRFYKVFDLNILDDYKINSRDDFSFLKKLTSEYIQKIFPPSQKIVIPDMLTLYELRNKYGYKVYFRYSLTKNINGKQETIDIKLEFKDILKAFMNVVYGYDGKDIENPEDYHVVAYLKGKTLRSIIDDFKAFLDGIKNFKGEDKEYIYFGYSTENLKRRFRPYNKEEFSNKYDATKWFWKNYIEHVKQEINTFHQLKYGLVNEIGFPSKPYLIIDEIEEVFVIEPSDSTTEVRKEKTYSRLFLQDFFVNEVKIGIAKSQNAEHGQPIVVEKNIDVAGYFELAMRTFFPAYVFELLVNNNKVDIASFPIDTLIGFAEDGNKYTLNKSLRAIPALVYIYGFLDKKSLLAREINKYDTEIYKKHDKFYDEFLDLSSNELRFAVSPFKFLYYVLENLRRSNIELVRMIYSSIGIISCKEFSKNLAKNIIVLSYSEIDIENQKDSKEECKNKYKTYHHNLQFMGSIISVVYYHLLINILKNINENEILSHYENNGKSVIKHILRDSKYLVYEDTYKLIFSGREPLDIYKLTSSLFLDILKDFLELQKTQKDNLLIKIVSPLLSVILEDIFGINKQEKLYEFLYTYHLSNTMTKNIDIWNNSHPYLQKYKLLNNFLSFYLYNRQYQQERNKILLKVLLDTFCKIEKPNKSFIELSLLFIFSKPFCSYLQQELKEDEEKYAFAVSMVKAMLYSFLTNYLKNNKFLDLLSKEKLYSKKGKPLQRYVFILKELLSNDKFFNDFSILYKNEKFKEIKELLKKRLKLKNIKKEEIEALYNITRYIKERLFNPNIEKSEYIRRFIEGKIEEYKNICEFLNKKIIKVFGKDIYNDISKLDGEKASDKDSSDYKFKYLNEECIKKEPKDVRRFLEGIDTILDILEYTLEIIKNEEKNNG